MFQYFDNNFTYRSLSFCELIPKIVMALSFLFEDHVGSQYGERLIDISDVNETHILNRCGWMVCLFQVQTVDDIHRVGCIAGWRYH